MTSNLSYLIYVSLASSPLSQTELDNILKASHQYNDDKLISGLLLYIEGHFFQVLEGPKEEVEGLFKTISGDKRHKNATIVAQGQLDKRLFKGWDMRFNSISEKEFSKLTGVNTFSSWFSVKPKDPQNPAWMFVKKFADKSFPSEGWWKG